MEAITKASEKFFEKASDHFKKNCKAAGPQEAVDPKDRENLLKIKDMAPTEIKTLKMPPCNKNARKINGINWSADGNRIAWCRQDHSCGVTDVKKNAGVYGMQMPWAQCIAMHPTRDIVITGGMDNAVKIWKPSDLASQAGTMVGIGQIVHHDGYIDSLEFMPSGAQFLSCSGDAVRARRPRRAPPCPRHAPLVRVPRAPARADSPQRGPRAQSSPLAGRAAGGPGVEEVGHPLLRPLQGRQRHDLRRRCAAPDVHVDLPRPSF